MMHGRGSVAVASLITSKSEAKLTKKKSGRHERASEGERV
jgi:hypothetical protein